VFGTRVVELGRRFPQLVALTAAMPGPTGLLEFQRQFPDRFFDVGIAEAHQMTAAAGLAMAGLRPLVAVYASFFSRAFDQAHLDVGLHHLPVVIVLDRAGVTGDDGPSHNGLADIALALQIPGMSVMAPSNAADLVKMLDHALDEDGPTVIRYPKTPLPIEPPTVELELGMARAVIAGSDPVALVGFGKMLWPALSAAKELSRSGLSVSVVDPRIVRPVSAELIEVLGAQKVVVTVEDGHAMGGAGSHLAAEIARHCLELGRRPPVVHNLGLPTSFLPHGRPEEILAGAGLDPAGIARFARSAVAAATPDP
jgi:1-deoxy-D-xylulose-5-phosphate synthase